MAYRNINKSVSGNFNVTLQLKKIKNIPSLSSSFIRNYFRNEENKNFSRKANGFLKSKSRFLSDLPFFDRQTFPAKHSHPPFLGVNGLRNVIERKISLTKAFFQGRETKDKKFENSASMNIGNAKEDKNNRNYLAFGLKQVKQRAAAPKQSVKLRYASDPNFFETKVSSKNPPAKGNFANNNVLSLIKQELLEIKIIKDRVNRLPHTNSDRQNDTRERDTKSETNVDAAESDGQVNNDKNVCAALIVVPQKIPAVQEEPEEDLRRSADVQE